MSAVEMGPGRGDLEVDCEAPSAELGHCSGGLGVECKVPSAKLGHDRGNLESGVQGVGR